MTDTNIDNVYLDYSAIEIVKQDEGFYNIVVDLLENNDAKKVAIALFQPDTESIFITPYLDVPFAIKDIEALTNRYESTFVAWYLDLALSKIHEECNYLPVDAVIKALPVIKNLQYPITLENGSNQVCNTPEELAFHWFTDLLVEGIDDLEECQNIRDVCKSFLNLH